MRCTITYRELAFMRVSAGKYTLGDLVISLMRFVFAPTHALNSNTNAQSPSSIESATREKGSEAAECCIRIEFIFERHPSTPP